MKGINYQVWLKAIPLKHAIEKKEKSDVLFSTDLGKKSLFQIFDILKTEVKIPSKNKEANLVEVIFKQFADDDLSTNKMIEETINNYIKDLRTNERLLKKIDVILIKLRKERIEFWEDIFDEYIKNQEKNNENLKKLWQERQTKLMNTRL